MDILFLCYRSTWSTIPLLRIGERKNNFFYIEITDL